MDNNHILPTTPRADIKQLLGAALRDYRQMGFIHDRTVPAIRIPQARVALGYALMQVVPRGQKMVWNAAYDEVADWLADNQGRGLLLMGPCGVGKTLIALQCLPLLIGAVEPRRIVTVCTAQELAANANRYQSKCLLAIDDVGTEAVERNTYGNITSPFADLLDHAEQHGHLLIVTTNLTPALIKERYGVRAADRCRSLFRCVRIQGDTLRQSAD